MFETFLKLFDILFSFTFMNMSPYWHEFLNLPLLEVAANFIDFW